MQPPSQRDRRPAEFLDQDKWQGKQVQGDTLLEVNTICSAKLASGTPGNSRSGHTRLGNRCVHNPLHAAQLVNHSLTLDGINQGRLVRV